MHKVERVRATLAGAPVDRPPVTVWYHFGTQHGSAARAAQAHLEFFEHYDLDLLKVMNDYDYPLPAGMDSMATAEQLLRLEPFQVADTPLGTQLQALERIAARVKGQALFLDTVFNAWNTLRRNLVREALPGLMERHPDAVEAALRVVNANLIQYARAALERGAAGIFLSVPASEEFLTREQYERFMRPFDLELLAALAGRGEMHVLHAHGEKLFLDRLLEYPVHVLSWADLNGGPSIAEMRGRFHGTLMAGLDHVNFAYVSPAVLRRQVAAARQQAGPTRFILAPGCSIPTYSFPALIDAVRDAVRGPWTGSP
jgi:uroporphyrinogen decarboxylase